LFFGAADLFQTRSGASHDENIRVFILRMKNAAIWTRHRNGLQLFTIFATTNRYLLISGCNSDVMRVLRNSGLLKQIGARMFSDEANRHFNKRALHGTRTGPERADIRSLRRLQKQGQNEVLAITRFKP